MGRLNDLMKGQRRRLLAAVLVSAAVGLFVAAGALALSRRAPSGDGRIDSRAQLERVLPAPARGTVAQSGGEERRDLLMAKGKRRSETSTHRKLVPVRIQMPIPVKIVIPAIGVAAPVIPLGLNSDRTLKVPNSFGDTGWFTGGPEPGERGAAVIVGHVDSRSGPAVFYRLRALRAGDVIKIILKDRSIVRYVINSTVAAAKNNFPTKLVYARTKKPTLRLITCDGLFDESTGHYVDNYIVFARHLSTSLRH